MLFIDLSLKNNRSKSLLWNDAFLSFLNRELLHHSNTNNSYHLYKYDGNNVTEIKDANNNSITLLVEAYGDGTTIYFSGYDFSVNDNIYYQYNGGTTATLVNNIPSGSMILGVVGNKLYLNNYNSATNTSSVYSYDGTTATLLVDSDNNNVQCNNLLFNDGIGYFTGSGAIWKTDGTTTNKLKDASGNDVQLEGYDLATYNGDLYFSGSQTSGNGKELWKYNGTVLSEVADIYPGTANGYSLSSEPANFKVYNGKLYFFCNYSK